MRLKLYLNVLAFGHASSRTSPSRLPAGEERWRIVGQPAGEKPASRFPGKATAVPPMGKDGDLGSGMLRGPRSGGGSGRELRGPRRREHAIPARSVGSERSLTTGSRRQRERGGGGGAWKGWKFVWKTYGKFTYAVILTSFSYCDTLPRN